jgi:hypothetical protein
MAFAKEAPEGYLDGFNEAEIRSTLVVAADLMRA